MSFADLNDIHRFSHEAMNTVFEILIRESRAEYARQVAAAVFAEMDRLERLLSKFDPGSEIAQINWLRPGESLRVSREVFDCLMLAARVYRETGGAFDVSFATRGAQVFPLEWLVLGAEGEADAGGTGAHIPFVGVRPTGDGESFPGLDINLGGIGKGFALDCARELLDDWGITSALLHGGTSSVLAIGSPSENHAEGWPVGVAGDWAGLVGFRRIYLQDRTLSGSGKEVKGEHILDPRTGKPAIGHIAAWVSSDSAAEADAFTTALMVMSAEQAAVFCAERPEIAALLIHRGEGGDTVTVCGTWPAILEK